VAPAQRRTKILATIGPASGDKDKLAALVDAGMDAARLNFSHASHDQHRSWAALIRDAADDAGRPLALVADLQGPKLRIGELSAPRLLTTGDEVVVAPEASAKDGELPISPAVIGEVLTPGHDVLIDDGLVRLRVEEVEDGCAKCRVVIGGPVRSHKGVNLPGVPLPIPSLTPKDVGDLELALELGVDYVALSFVRSAADVRELRELISEADSHAEVIAKIEKAEAVDALDDILAETDAIMVARGDLGVEIGPASVPLLQKRIILRSLELGKPVITATQMLESMIEHAEPTRAEASDVANAVLDGTSAVMRSAETATGNSPVEGVRTMDSIARAPSASARAHAAFDLARPTVGVASGSGLWCREPRLGSTALMIRSM
jgi:pyruvate kinase